MDYENYSYTKNIKCPKVKTLAKLKENPTKNMIQLAKASSDYTIGYLISGTSIFDNKDDYVLGTNYFIDSGIQCGPGSEPECVGKTRQTYVRNIPTGQVPVLETSFLSLTGCELQGLTEGRGLMMSMIEDAADLNPVKLGNGILGYGNLGEAQCRQVTLPVGSRIYDASKRDKTWTMRTECTGSYKHFTTTTDVDFNAQLKDVNPKMPNVGIPR